MKAPSRSGFTLIETAIVLLIGSLFVAAFAETARIINHKHTMDTTKTRLQTIKAALDKFQAKNGRLPCPAALHDAPTTTSFGVEATCTGNGDPAKVDGKDSGTKVWIGTVPVTTLGLSADTLTDAWGWRFLYAASGNLVSTTPEPKGSDYGQITLVNASGTTVGPNPDHTPYVLFSFGRGGRGAVTSEGQDSPNDCHATGPEHENCDMADAKFNDATYSESTDPAYRFNHIISNTLSAVSNDPSVVCGNKGMIYGPTHPRADSSGCIPDLKVADTGNVGIGTATPTFQLDVQHSANTPAGQFRVDGPGIQTALQLTNRNTPGGAAGEGPELTFVGGLGSNIATIIGAWSSPTTDGYLTLNTRRGGDMKEALRITSNGYVGIGTTNPNHLFHVFNPNDNTYSGLFETDKLYTRIAIKSSLGQWDLMGGGDSQNEFVIFNPGGASYALSIRGSDGFVNIGSSRNPAYKLDVEGSIRAQGTVYSNSTALTSDRRFKKEIQPYAPSALDIVSKLKPVTFLWKDPKDDGMKGRQIGFIAQEVQPLIPEAVLTMHNKEKTLGIKYDGLIPVLTKAIQEQQKQIQQLQEQLRSLETQH